MGYHLPHGNQSESECIFVAKSAKSAKYLRVYLQKPRYTWVIPALLHGFASWDHTHSRYTNQHSAYHFRIPLYHTTSKLIKISPNTGLIPVKFEHWLCMKRPARRRSSPMELAPRLNPAFLSPCCRFISRAQSRYCRDRPYAQYLD